MITDDSEVIVFKEEDMRNLHTAAFAIATLLTLPTMGLAATAAGAARMHEIKGVVRFVDPTTLAITRLAPYGERRMTFELKPSTEREGHMRVGSTVEVRYRAEGNRRVATDVIVEHAKEPPSISGSHQ
jgi:hypothetical protein